ncbi:hypothetical protein AB0O01_20920 [Streptomyces sp. NPDC093252]|uniref:hypothetical protein n=1 Tax=Streptomyces sp. NPDC093252 TaxID=3154980 RepID=UPI003416A1E9
MVLGIVLFVAVVWIALFVVVAVVLRRTRSLRGRPSARSGRGRSYGSGEGGAAGAVGSDGGSWWSGSSGGGHSCGGGSSSSSCGGGGGGGGCGGGGG